MLDGEIVVERLAAVLNVTTRKCPLPVYYEAGIKAGIYLHLLATGVPIEQAQAAMEVIIQRARDIAPHIAEQIVTETELRFVMSDMVATIQDIIEVGDPES